MRHGDLIVCCDSSGLENIPNAMERRFNKALHMNASVAHFPGTKQLHSLAVNNTFLSELNDVL